ncbi:MAG: hypothetical protein V4469_03965 [Patescibacteria group bacterium]
MKIKKKILLGLIALIIICLVFVYIPRSIKLNPTELSANWSDYEFPEAGFSFKYPKDVLAISTEFSQQSDLPGALTLRKDVAELTFKPLQNTNITLNEFSKIFFANNEHCNSVTKKYTINDSIDAEGFECVQAELGAKNETTWTVIILKTTNTAYGIAYNSNSDNQTEKIFKEIIANFKPIPVTKKDGIKYTDPDNLFTLNYPEHGWKIIAGRSPVYFPEGNEDSIDVNLFSTDLKTVSIMAIKNTTLEKYEKFQRGSIVNCGPKSEYFLSKMTGLKCTYQDEDTYFFEKNNNLYFIKIGIFPPSDKVDLENDPEIKSILNHFIIL